MEISRKSCLLWLLESLVYIDFQKVLSILTFRKSCSFWLLTSWVFQTIELVVDTCKYTLPFTHQSFELVAIGWWSKTKHGHWNYPTGCWMTVFYFNPIDNLNFLSSLLTNIKYFCALVLDTIFWYYDVCVIYFVCWCASGPIWGCDCMVVLFSDMQAIES